MNETYRKMDTGMAAMFKLEGLQLGNVAEGCQN